ncbi:MAG: hypothetical protein GW938_07085 [Leptospira sp.]|nr:hypothetical protein [Leptospira sp.]NCS93954.1 hypothetical protein [Leptospira sp.]
MDEVVVGVVEVVSAEFSALVLLVLNQINTNKSQFIEQPSEDFSKSCPSGINNG